MSRRFDVPLDDLIARAQVPVEEQATTQERPRWGEPPDGLHPFGDGATGPDGDGD